jgi:cobalt/nickel transport system permease protein
MHIPDGFLSTPVWASLGAASIPAVGYMARRAQRETEETRVPMLGVMGAFVFAAQMINFPVGPGASGHLLGGALLGVTLGPTAAVIVMTAILAVQALVFQDGGVLALGANVFNLAVVGVLSGYLPYHWWGSGKWRNAAIFVGGFFSVMLGALLAMSQLLLSGVTMHMGVVWASMALFTINALLEGAITLTVVQAIEKMNPTLIRKSSGDRGLVSGALLLAAGFLAVVGVLFASGSPDGLEKFAETLGIADRAQTLLPSAFPDYELNLFRSEWLRKAAAGLAGLCLIYGLCLLLGRIVVRHRSA